MTEPTRPPQRQYPTPPDLTPEEHAQRRARSRRAGQALTVLVLGIAAATAVAAIVSLDGADDEDQSLPTAEGAPAATEFFEVESRNHVADRVTYMQTPPVGGDHNPTWWDCGAYSEPVVPEAAVHSLEHGAVWVTYTPDLPPAQVEKLEQLAERSFVLVSPWPDAELPAPIVLSAWGAQLQVDELPSTDAEAFLQTFRQGRTAPEPGAPCTGGASG